jgi:uroporphyrinogen decarboxylase
MMSDGATTRRDRKPLLRVFAGKDVAQPPWWLMRQAGRYLPEYRILRARAGDFVELCLSPALAAEITLQPVRRFGMDAAILFSDILLLPWALGQNLAFREGEGPVLDPPLDSAEVVRLDRRGISRLDPVFETVRRVAAALSPETALIGFAGAPWTVAAYMAEGGASRDFLRVKEWAYRDPTSFAALIDVLTEATIAFLSGQIAAGAEIVQLFDSWAGVLYEDAFENWVIGPARRIVAVLKARFPDCPIVAFPRGAGVLYERYVAETAVDGIGIDTAVPASWAAERLQNRAVVQGNLDPVLLVAGGATLDAAIIALRRRLGRGRYVFNLGHGVLPQTPPENIIRLARLLADPTDQQ